MKKYKIALLTGVTSLLPFVAFAAEGGGCNVPRDFTGLFEYAICLLNGYVIPFLISLGLIIFIVGIVSYVKAGDDEEKRSQGRNMMLFGIIALFVMISAWGLVRIIHNSIFGADKAFENPTLPPRSNEVFKRQ